MARPRRSPDERRARAALAYAERHGRWYSRLPHGAVALRSPKKGPLVAAMYYVGDQTEPGQPAPEQWQPALSEIQVAELLKLPRERVEEMGQQGRLPVLGWFGPLRLYALREVLAEHEKQTEAMPLLEFAAKKPVKTRRAAKKAGASAVGAKDEPQEAAGGMEPETEPAVEKTEEPSA